MDIKNIIREYDRILFTLTGIPHIMKTFATIESDITAHAKRVEPGFYRRYMKGKPHWEKYVNKYGDDAYSSLGIFQIMFPTALLYDRQLTPEDLKNPYINTFIAYRIIKRNIEKYGVANLDEWVQQYHGGYTRSNKSEADLKKEVTTWQKIENTDRDKLPKVRI